MEDKQDKEYKEKSRDYIKWAATVLAILIVLLVGVFLVQHFPGMYNNDISSGTLDSSGEYYNNKSPGDNSMEYIKNNSTSAPLIKVDTTPASYTVLVNRDYPMPEDYVPEDLVIPSVEYSYKGIYEKSYMRKAAAKAIEKMFKEAAKKKKFRLKVVSAYRSYERQKAIYQNNINTRGEEDTNKVSAKPGCSEHQTGLAVDVSSDTVDCTIEKSFASCPEGRWLAKNCHKFGFIIRYPKGKSGITGYSYEPWHIRYVGVNLAKYIYKKKITLEEYYQTTTVDDKVPEDSYIKDVDTNAPKGPQVNTAPTPKTTAYAVKTQAPPQPVATQPLARTREPEKTKEPGITKQPVKTKEPEKTQKPEETQKPEKTQKPKKTQKPEKTHEPEETQKPEKTQKPEETQKPEKIYEPVKTEEPENTPEPVRTKEPAETQKPAEDTTIPSVKEPAEEPGSGDGTVEDANIQ
ncbi:MAG: D-alanyl-D-alanine carboxypeptidase family protein [Lachnospiraceae bacterium]